MNNQNWSSFSYHMEYDNLPSEWHGWNKHKKEICKKFPDLARAEHDIHASDNVFDIQAAYNVFSRVAVVARRYAS